MNILIETYHRLLNEKRGVYHRKLYDDLSFENRMTGIVGGRGVGKTTLLVHYLRKNWSGRDDAIYISADHLYFSEVSLLEFVDRFYKEYDAKVVCIDEIHKYANWGQELKNIYDSYPGLKIIFSGSSSLNLVKGRYDLSRRAILKTVHGFSFREFLEFRLQKKFPVFPLDAITGREQLPASDIPETPRLLGHLKEYFVGGYYPIFTEMPDHVSFRDAMVAIVDKTIFEDVSKFYSLKTGNLEILRKLIYFIATSPPGSINVNNLANSLKRDHSTISEYLEMLRECGLLRFLLNDKRGHRLIRIAEKLYLDNTNLLHAICESIGKDVDTGTSRELFVISQLENSGHEVFYSAKGDIVCEGYIFEIGGKHKGRRQIAHIENSRVIKDGIIMGEKGVIPLCLFGFLS